VQIGGSVRVLPDLVHHSASPSIDIDSAARLCLKVVVGQLPVDAAIERCGRGKISPDQDAPYAADPDVLLPDGRE